MLPLLSVAVLSAQEQTRRTEPAQNGRAAAVQPADQTIADCLGISNQEEIALATLAAAKTQNPQVKQFAEQLVRDHGQALAQLERFGARKIELARRSENRPDADRPDDRPEPARSERPAVATRDDAAPSRRTAANEPGLNFNEIKREMAQKCLASAQKEWAELKGNEADECFVGTQLVLHKQMVNAQEVLKRHASPELQAVIEESIAVTKSHADQAEQLMKQLAHGEREAARN
jgi:predicted outer membrane protein